MSAPISPGGFAYVVLRIFPWSSLKADTPGFSIEAGITEPGCIGFLACYSSREEAEAANPGSNIVTVLIGEAVNDKT